jgi:hypothetical protein
VTWNGHETLQQDFNDFLLGQAYPNAFDALAMPRRWRQAQTILSGACLRLKLRGAIGAASLTKW